MHRYSTKIIAVDFVLLPADPEVEQLIRLNQRLSQPDDRQIVLTKNGNLPHLSLLMGGLSTEGLESTATRLQTLATSLRKFCLKIVETAYRNDCTSLSVEKREDLMHLHKTLMEKFDGLINRGISAEMFHKPQAISESSVSYVNTFRQQSAGEQYWPHITLGYGKLRNTSGIPGGICFDKIGLFHLGNHCTCSRKILTISLAAG